VENQIRLISIGRSNNAVRQISAGGPARRHDHEPGALGAPEWHGPVRDVLERLPAQPASRIDELLPHCWQPGSSAS
jgi:hypothetical protein